jgi:amino acid transporter
VDSQTAVSTETASEPSTAGRLKPDSLGVLGILFFVLSAQAPLTGIAGAVPIAVAIGNGAGTPAAYLAAGAVVLLFSVGFVAMGRHVVDAGAFYTYIGKGLGRPTGSGSAAVALFAYCAIQAAMYGLYGATVSGLVEHYTGTHVAWWVWTLVTMVIVQILGASGIEMGAKILTVFVLAEFSVLIVFALVTLFKGGGPEGLGLTDSFSPSAALQGAPGVALMFAVASMFGFEATAIYGEEARNPRRTVPLATYLAVVLIGAFYALSSWAIVLAFGSDGVVAAAQADTAGLVFTAAAEYVSPVVADVMLVLLLTSLFAALLAFHNAISRYLFALGRQGMAPDVLSRTHVRHASPHVGSLAQTGTAFVVVAVFAVAGSDPVLQLFTWMSGLATVSILLLMVLTSVAVLAFFARSRVDRRTWHTRVAPALGTLGLLGVVGLVLANFTTLISGDAVLATVLLTVIAAAFALGVVVALVRRPRRTPAG